MVPRNIEGVWKAAYQFAKQNPKIWADVMVAQERNPLEISDSDFLRECAWAIYGAGFKISVLDKMWPDIQKAFLYWDVSKIVEHCESVRMEVLQINGHKGKVNSIIKIAKWLNEQGWHTVHTKFLSLAIKDNQGNPVITDDLLNWLDQLPWIGQTLAAYVAKDLGVESIKPDRRICRLANWLGYSPDADGVWQMALDTQAISGKKINVIDTVLWNWASKQDWLPKI